MNPKTNPEIVEDKRTYHEKHGAALGLPPFTAEPSGLPLSADLGRLTAHAFNAMDHKPGDPAVKSAYDALKSETKAQYDHLASRGVRFEPWVSHGQPYADSREMSEDAKNNRHLWYFPSVSGFGSDDRFADHPLMDKVPEGGSYPPGAVYNDLFRAVHDWYAHAMHGHQFGPKGELKAWHEHARMFSPEARKALTTETHGQNSWVNFGPHLKGDEKPTDKPYADQKAGLLDESLHPAKLARPTAGVTGLGAANRQTNSDNHTARIALARQIIQEAGLKGLVKGVLAHQNGSSRPSVAAFVSQAGEQHALYAGAWLGLLTQQPAVSVFTPGEGEDVLHVIDSPHPTDHVANYLNRSGVKNFTTQAKGSGTRAFIINPPGDASGVARGLDAKHSALPGSAKRLGAGTGPAAGGTAAQADARAAYRTVIRDAERAAGSP